MNYEEFESMVENMNPDNDYEYRLWLIAENVRVALKELKFRNSWSAGNAEKYLFRTADMFDMNIPVEE
tara:strand:- start:1112 stop:1315 length:204 start_codon:yes stop_codon:yes gene_type:complete